MNRRTFLKHLAQLAGAAGIASLALRCSPDAPALPALDQPDFFMPPLLDSSELEIVARAGQAEIQPGSPVHW